MRSARPCARQVAILREADTNRCVLSLPGEEGLLAGAVLVLKGIAKTARQLVHPATLSTSDKLLRKAIWPHPPKPRRSDQCFASNLGTRSCGPLGAESCIPGGPSTA